MSATEREAMFLRPTEAAALAGLSTRAIYRAIQRGELHAVRLCSRLRIPRGAFEEWVERSAVRVERLVADVRVTPAAHGSFRRLLSGDQDARTPP
jgi:excisionase family DNA binding protein